MPRALKRTDKFGGIMAERTVLLDATEAVIGAHLTLIANGTVADRRHVIQAGVDLADRNQLARVDAAWL